MTVPEKQQLNRVAKARLKAESAALNNNMGKFKTGAHDPRPKRERTRSAAVKKAIKEQD